LGKVKYFTMAQLAKDMRQTEKDIKIQASIYETARENARRRKQKNISFF